ncbi:MAG: hypothetical protein CVT89_01685 [Candidatus Altiarchaeales archaeon HGW-Altiarchaeales-2]|nr:MAG: hypothetical protein CVT89_01685 [Candidatus Altiarchaeales archaeon HGW-Altiarchaeales-2]
MEEKAILSLNRKAILLRSYSEESNTAEKILKKANIDYVQIFLPEGDHSPSIISQDSAYPYEGIGGIQLFVRGANKTK